MTSVSLTQTDISCSDTAAFAALFGCAKIQFHAKAHMTKACCQNDSMLSTHHSQLQVLLVTVGYIYIKAYALLGNSWPNKPTIPGLCCHMMKDKEQQDANTASVEGHYSVMKM